MATQPLRPLASADSWRQTHALALLGGPIAPPADAALRLVVETQEWEGGSQFGPFGSCGEPLSTGQTGTPRNQPMTPELMHAAQTGDPRPLLILEQKAWVQAMRPYHLHGLRVSNADNLLLWDGVPIHPGSRDLSPESLGRRRLRDQDPYAAYRTMAQGGSQHAHGFEPFDQEHWTSDLVFDYWTISGDAWAGDEMRQLGESLRGLLRPQGFYTSTLQSPRAEGWALQGLVQAYLATGDLRYRSFALDRLHDIVDEERLRGHPSRALKLEGADPRTGFPGEHRYYMPWQHGALLYGCLAAYKFFGDPLFLSLGEDVAHSVHYAWATDFVDAQLGLVPHALRYYCPVEAQGQPVAPDHFDALVGVRFGDEPLRGAHSLLVGGLLLLGQVTIDPLTATRAETYGSLLLQLPLEDRDRWDKWFSVVPSGYGW
jgi:hypothetical protein